MPLPSKSKLAKALLQELGEYDGKATTTLGETERRWSQDPDYLQTLVDLLARTDPVIQNGASWLLKSSFEKDVPTDAALPANLTRQAVSLTDWAAKLHVCQSVQHLTFTPDDAHKLLKWVRHLLDHDRPFLRAWALDASVHLSTFDTGLRQDVLAALAKALDDPAASVRARARKLKMSENS